MPEFLERRYNRGIICREGGWGIIAIWVDNAEEGKKLVKDLILADEPGG